MKKKDREGKAKEEGMTIVDLVIPPGVGADDVLERSEACL